MKVKKGSRLYGFEDYEVVYVGEFSFYTANPWMPYTTSSSAVTYLTLDMNLPVNVKRKGRDCCDVIFSPALCSDHPELLDTAKKVYVHPSCKISRSMVAEKYGKSLNPWLCDAVVIPDVKNENSYIANTAIFCNDAAKLMVIIELYDHSLIATAAAFQSGTTFKSLITGDLGRRTTEYNMSDVLNAEFFYSGECLVVFNSESFVLDILTRKLPVAKTVFEQTVQKSLSSKDNQLSLNILNNIRDMLESSDNETVSAGLKALSMMDYMHYPNSVRYIIKNLHRNNYYYNKAANSTSVRFMREQLSGSSKRNMWPGRYDMEIYEQDYKLLKQLILHYEPYYKEDILSRMKDFPFMKVSNDGILIPRLKQ